MLGAHAVVKGTIPDFSIAVGSPAKAVKNRRADWEAGAADRAKYIAALEDIARKKLASNGADAAPAVNGNGAGSQA